MAENLRVTKYNDGSEINSDDYSSYDEGENNLNFFGYLYSRSPFSNNSSNVCPEGWRTPEKSDVYELKTFLGDDAGSKLAGSVGLWEAGDLRDNAEFGSSGFNALPGGYYNGLQDLYEYLLSVAYFHMVTPSELMWQSQDRFIIKYDNTSVDYGMYQFYESYQLSIRCLR